MSIVNKSKLSGNIPYMQKKHRIFIAINLPLEIKKQLSKLQEKWSRSRSNRGSSIESGPELPARWTEINNLHITLVFLGYLTDEEVGDVCMVVKEASSKHNSFNINLDRVGYGPNNKIPPRYVWIGGKRSKELLVLKKDLEELISGKINFKPENRAFNPHITLARINTFQWRQINPEERQDINESVSLSFAVESVEVMESILKRGGPEYVVLESFNLNQ